MKTGFILFFFLFILFPHAEAQVNLSSKLPDAVYSGKQGPFHVQGVAVDTTNGFVYFSFTNTLVKTDLAGRFIGSVSGFTGHLGDLDFDPVSNKIYASLEFKNDAIGQGIRKRLGVSDELNTGFYIAIFDARRIDQPNMDAEKENLLSTVYLKEVVEDYQATVKEGTRSLRHRFGCSGIDGVALAPAIGKGKDSKKYLYVAYGIYGDTTRSDNDYQVILQYDISHWEQYGQYLSQQKLHLSGPAKPLKKYFVKTGNTSYGIQNLAYDPYTGNLFAAVYPGKKSQFPNYSLFVIDRMKKPFISSFLSDNRKIKVKTLSLWQPAENSENTGTPGWHFKWGATGLCPLGDGLFYISHDKKTDDGLQETTIYKYKWIGNSKASFVRP